MNSAISRILSGQDWGQGNIFPFFWVHGEPEETIREYMDAVYRANLRAVCVESRPHPDFAGPQWWHDMDIILDEARRRGMKVWILDDSHFPTGYANGALEHADSGLCRQSLVRVELGTAAPGAPLRVEPGQCTVPPWVPNQMEQFSLPNIRTFDDDRLLGVAAVENGPGGGLLDLTPQAGEGDFSFCPPDGEWTVYALLLTRNRGPHRSYINMMDRASCRVLIDAVYEPHWQRYREDFGKTIAGFFSDEPEIGNGHLYQSGGRFWEEEDQAWSAQVEEELRSRLGGDFVKYLPLLWAGSFDPDRTAAVRKTYMDAVTGAVRECFSQQIGDWCRERGVEYIGHLIEDNNQHLRCGSSLGHYFRGLFGQDMAGIDDIGGQVLPQGEWNGESNSLAGNRNGLFYHFVLGKLGSSLAAMDPKKRGRCMCELFGAYGWEEGVRLEKYLCDHFLVRGVNRFVPHAFSLRDYPDPDCPPHFYAHGHNPQFRHFGALMAYLGRMSQLFSRGRAVAPAAILYNAEADWMGDSLSLEAVAQPLCEAQIDYQFLPLDVFAQREVWNTTIGGDGFSVNGNRYRALIVPGCDCLPQEAVGIFRELEAAGCPVYFAGHQARGFDWVPVVDCARLPQTLAGLETVQAEPANRYIRSMEYVREDMGTLYLLVNEGAEPFTGSIRLPKAAEACHAYNAWDNRLEALPFHREGDRLVLDVTLEPLKSLVVLLGEPEGELHAPVEAKGDLRVLSGGWRRSVCTSTEYPHFREEKAVSLPDPLAEEQPLFSGFARYERNYDHQGGRAVLEITDAYEGVEVFVNGESQDIQIAPPFRYDLTAALRPGENQLGIEVATTLERDTSALPNPMAEWLGKTSEPPTVPSGISGQVRMWLS